MVINWDKVKYIFCVRIDFDYGLFDDCNGLLDGCDVWVKINEVLRELNENGLEIFVYWLYLFLIYF